MRKLVLPLALCALLAACNAPTGDVLDDDSMSSDDAIMETTSSPAAMEAASSAVTSEPEAMAPTGETRVIEMTATEWSFSPNSITVKKGEKVAIRLKGIDGKHSLSIDGLNINVEINPGETKDIVIPTDKVGTLAFRCRIPCGEGHMDMKGEIVVQE